MANSRNTTETGSVEPSSVDGELATQISAEHLEPFATAAPAEFDGPGDLWSPETLLLGAVVSCFILSFRAIAAASRLEWRSLSCAATGRLDRVNRQTRFVEIEIAAELAVEDASRRDAANRVLDKAKQHCLVSNSLNCDVQLSAEVTTTD